MNFNVENVHARHSPALRPTALCFDAHFHHIVVVMQLLLLLLCWVFGLDDEVNNLLVIVRDAGGTRLVK